MYRTATVPRQQEGEREGVQEKQTKTPLNSRETKTYIARIRAVQTEADRQQTKHGKNGVQAFVICVLVHLAPYIL